ncbi:MAG: biotin--[acetyl-CoA-carboxylase] ligase [Hyphomicrobiaceae bacterium]
MLPSATRIVEFETIDSTNTEAHRRAADGERGPIWLRSDAQEAGRGRSGRPWSSPPGNLSATYMFTPECPRSVFHHLSFVAAVAAHDAIAPNLTSGKALQLKWPNDLLINSAKVGGILVESSKYDSDIVVMIGIGINIAVLPDVDGRNVTKLDAHGPAPSPSQLVQHLADMMTAWLTTWDNGREFETVRQAWLARAHPLGQALTVNTNERQLAGTFAGLAENGALLLATHAGETCRVEHGDVALAATIPVPERRHE